MDKKELTPNIGSSELEVGRSNRPAHFITGGMDESAGLKLATRKSYNPHLPACQPRANGKYMSNTPDVRRIHEGCTKEVRRKYEWTI